MKINYILKGPVVVVGDTVNQVNVSTGHASDWSIPTVPDSAVDIASVETFKVFV